SSAFSYEDLYSHSVGAAVAVRALRTPGVSFDEAVTTELQRELADLEIVPQELCLRAMSLVENRWWAGKQVLKRNLDTGTDNGRIDPWLVRNLEPGKSPRPKSYAPARRDFSRVAGYRCRDILVLSCEPHLPNKKRMRAVLGAGAKRVRPDRDYAAIMT